MSDKLDKISKLIKESFDSVDEDTGDLVTDVLKQVIKIERDCLYGEKSSRGKKKEIMALIARYAQED